MRSGRTLILAALAGLVGYVALLAVVPRLIPASAAGEVVSAALTRGYNAPLAYSTALAWTLALVGLALFLGRRVAAGAATPSGEAPPCGRLVPLELIAVAAVFFIAYFPLFLARQGPLTEDHGFITGIFRMACGQTPYRDFEFLYGPSMIYSLWWWAQIFGVSMKSYYGFLAVQEAVQFTILMAVLQLAIKDRWTRFAVFLLLAPFLLDTLLGVNWSALRRLLAVFAMLLAASRPFDLRTNVMVGILVGLYATYSHEYAAATLFGIGLMYAVHLFGSNWRKALISGPIIALLSGMVWAGGVLVMLGSDWPYYIETLQRVVGTMSQGHVSFEFYWTLNSLALFTLLSLACILFGIALPRLSRGVARGDLFFIGALGFAVVTLKSGLTRADHWHLDAAFIALIFAFLLQLETRVIRISVTTRRFAVLLICVASATYLLGIYGTGKRYAGAYLRGAQEVLGGVPTADVSPDTFRQISVEPERTNPEPNLTSIGQYLAKPATAARPVTYYGTAWMLAPRIGVCSQYFALDALMYSEIQSPLRDFLEKHPDAFVVMSRADYERVFDGKSEPESALSTLPKLASWLTSPHYTQSALEGALLDKARDEVSGAYLREHYEIDNGPDFPGLALLLKRKAS